MIAVFAFDHQSLWFYIIGTD